MLSDDYLSLGLDTNRYRLYEKYGTLRVALLHYPEAPMVSVARQPTEYLIRIQRDGGNYFASRSRVASKIAELYERIGYPVADSESGHIPASGDQERADAVDQRPGGMTSVQQRTGETVTPG
jgi:hypothetical protein